MTELYGPVLGLCLVACSSASGSTSGGSTSASAVGKTAAPSRSGAPSSTSNASGASASAAGSADPSGVTATYTGREDKSGNTLVSVTNTTQKPVHWMHFYVYAYDKDKKQLTFSDKRKFATAGYTDDIAPGATLEVWSNDFTKNGLPEGTVTVQLVTHLVQDEHDHDLYNLKSDPAADRPQQ